MNSTEKKLDALIDALGFECEKVCDIKRMYKPSDVNDKGEPKENAMPAHIIDNSSYKLTKKVRHYELTKPMIENIIGVLEGHDNDDVHILINNLEVMINENI